MKQGGHARVTVFLSLCALFFIHVSGAIAIVVAYHYPEALNDFNVFARQFKLPLETSAKATLKSNRVFQQVYVDASGNRTVVPTDVDRGWNTEAALDVQWAHALAPGAKIYLVESASDLLEHMLAAVNVAKTLPGVMVVSMSWGAYETDVLLDNDPTVYSSIVDAALLQPGVVFVAASGDDGGTSISPSSSPNCISVGGTSLVLDGNHSYRVISETAWEGSGGGLTILGGPLPAFQTSVALLKDNFIGRATPDISLVADPLTGVAIYFSFNYTEGPRWYQNWIQVGGTSVSAPCMAGMLNLAGTARGHFPSSSQEALSYMYRTAAVVGSSNFRDITEGAAGPFPARRGWDFTTGLGSPLGLAFVPPQPGSTRRTTPGRTSQRSSRRGG